jgi:predicted extracellular nuclease
VISADFQGTAALSGYFVQEEASDTDADPLTSEGIFIDESAGTLGDVIAGSRVRLTGTIQETGGMTTLTGATRLLTCGAAEAVEPKELTLPVDSLTEWEQYEGMLVQVQQSLTVADTSELGTRGRLTLVEGGAPRQYTQEHQPDQAGYAAWENELARRTVILDDGSAADYADPIRYPPPGLSASNTLRAGDAVAAGLTGALDGRSEGALIQPTLPAVFQSENDRAAAPTRGAGDVRAVFLSLNDYFNATGAGGSRGANSAEEFARQRGKLIAALLGLDADVITVSKLQNNGFGTDGAIADLVSGLNSASAPGTYAFVDPGAPGWGRDAVSVGVIYRGVTLRPVGGPALLDTGAFEQEPAPPVHRAPMAQTFEDGTWGERFTVVVNEWHDRVACPSSGLDADVGDGQGCWNSARTSAAEELATWLSSDPTSSSDPDILLLGDLNAFPLEDPVASLASNGMPTLSNTTLGRTPSQPSAALERATPATRSPPRRCSPSS